MSSSGVDAEGLPGRPLVRTLPPSFGGAGRFGGSAEGPPAAPRRRAGRAAAGRRPALGTAALSWRLPASRLAQGVLCRLLGVTPGWGSAKSALQGYSTCEAEKVRFPGYKADR